MSNLLHVSEFLTPMQYRHVTSNQCPDQHLSTVYFTSIFQLALWKFEVVPWAGGDSV